MQSVKKIQSLKGKRVLVRADFNVPLGENGKVADTFRIKAALPTIEFLRSKGAKVILISHIGRETDESLKPVYEVLKRYIPVKFVPEILSDNVNEVLNDMKTGDVVMLENLRSNPGEKDCDKKFAKALSLLGDIYVNEAFPVSHRGDASIVLLPKILPAFAGLQFELEVNQLSKVLKPKHPFLFIQGGAKAETKIPLLKKFAKDADSIFIGGQLANDFFKAQGFYIGKSKIDEGLPPLKPFLKDNKFIIPRTVVVHRGKNKKKTIPVGEVGVDESIFDIGLSDIESLKEKIKSAKLILWNGPMGWYESGYTEATETLLKLLSSTKGETIIGGGDTAVLVDKKKLSKKFTFVSTGGGATLEFLAKGTLPGIKALK